MPSQDTAAKRAIFRGLHQTGCFVIPNPWDAGGARALEQLGYRALATTSAGFAFSRGLPDSGGALSRDQIIDHIAEIVDATDLPVNADFQSGYGATLDQLAESVSRCVQTGVAGLSIEDLTDQGTLFDRQQSVERVAAARAAIDSTSEDVLLTARSECFLLDMADPLPETIERLAAYSAAGADVLYAPGIKDVAAIEAIVQAAAAKPVNLLIHADMGLSVADVATLGVRRISVGSALSRVAWGAFLRAAQTIAEEGSFDRLADGAPYAELNALFEP